MWRSVAAAGLVFLLVMQAQAQGQYAVYLPRVVDLRPTKRPTNTVTATPSSTPGATNSPTNTPTNTATATATHDPTQCPTECTLPPVVVTAFWTNTGYEPGPQDLPFYRTGPLAHSGNAYLEFGGTAATLQEVNEQGIIPTPHLSYWVWIESTETNCTDGDTAGIYMQLGTVIVTADEFPLCTQTNTNGWVQRIADVSAFQDQDVEIRFSVNADTNLCNSRVRLDDVLWEP